MTQVVMRIEKRILKSGFLSIVVVFMLNCGNAKSSPITKPATETTDFNKLSETFLEKILEGKDTQEEQDLLNNVTVTQLSKVLATDDQRYAFWINIYNAYIISILTEHPELYSDKDDFFSRPQLKIAGEYFSFDLIEHGILRKSQWKLGLGHVRKWFPNSVERTLRVDKRDYRIHFALNCGAKDCPPVAIYTPEKIQEQLKKGTTIYLTQTTDFDSTTNEANVTALFSWFRGDFGGKAGIKRILKEHGAIPATKGVGLNFKSYDWTLDLDNTVEL